MPEELAVSPTFVTSHPPPGPERRATTLPVRSDRHYTASGHKFNLKKVEGEVSHWEDAEDLAFGGRMARRARLACVDALNTWADGMALRAMAACAMPDGSRALVFARDSEVVCAPLLRSRLCTTEGDLLSGLERFSMWKICLTRSMPRA